MNFEQVIELVKTVSDSELTSFQYEEEGQKIVMQTGNFVGSEQQLLYGASKEKETGVSGGQATDAPVAQTSVSGGNQVCSPLVGRFYVAPSEDAEPFVKVGDTVKKGQVVAIVEAMKLMNEIESEYDGTVTEVLVQDGEAVEYGQPLFVIA